MDELPRIDPNWMRKRQPPPTDDSHLAAILISAALLLPAVWFVRAHFQFEGVRNEAVSRSSALADAAHDRQAEELDAQRAPVRYITEAQADREIAEAGGASLGDETIHRCFQGTRRVYQSAPCNASWADQAPAPTYSRQDVAAQAQMRARAEAQLAAEQQRFAQLTGQQGGYAQPGYQPNPAEAARQRCAWTKAQRDEAYRLVGNGRTFDFIRGWNDRVAEACKDT